MASSVRNMRLASVDDLFSTEETRQAEARQQGEQILTVPIAEIHDFENNPYQVRHDAELMDMAESIARLGVHTPCLARPRKDGGYELLSGHRRKTASMIAGKDMSRTSKITALYERLSRDDDLNGESNSITNHDVMYRGWITPINITS